MMAQYHGQKQAITSLAQKIQKINLLKVQPAIPTTPTTPTPALAKPTKPITAEHTGVGTTVFQPTQTKTEQQKIAEENARRVQLGFPPLSGGTTTTSSQTYPLTIDASGNITNLKDMPTSQLLDLYSSFG